MSDHKRGNFISMQIKHLLRFLNLHTSYFKRQLRRYHPQRRDNLLQTFGAYQRQRFFAFCISHCQQHPGKTADVIRMIMRKTDRIDRMKTPSGFFHGDLCPFSAVDHQTAPIISGHQGSQIPIWQRHHSCRSKQTYI